MAIEWKKEYSVNVSEIDEQHKRFLVILNSLYDAIRSHAGQERLAQILTELIAYAEMHFSTEEKYFDKFHYESTQEHKREHKLLREKLEDFVKRCNDHETSISFDLVDFLEDWFVHHDSSYDKKYTRCFNDHGLF